MHWKYVKYDANLQGKNCKICSNIIDVGIYSINLYI